MRKREYQVGVFRYEVYYAMLKECLLNREALQSDSTCVIKAQPGDFISKDVNLVFYLSLYPLVHSSNWRL